MPAKTMQEWKEQSKGLAPEIAQAAWKYALKIGGGDRKKSLPYYQLLLETAQQESKLGKLDPANPMQLTKGTVKDLNNRYTKELGGWLGDVQTPLDMQMGVASFLYGKRLKAKDDLSTLEGRAKVWKDKYNTSAGAGTPEKYISNNSHWKWGD